MRSIRIILIGLVFLFLFSLVFTDSGDFNQDLGRHIKLGEIISKTGKIPESNKFSFTHPDFPFVNHHWLSEVLFYGTATFASTATFVYLKVIIILTSAALAIYTALQRSKSTVVSLTVTLLISPLLLERSDIRPELFGYLFFSYLLMMTLLNPSRLRYFYTSIPIMILWVNLHITFIFGLLLISMLITRLVFDAYIKKNPDPAFRSKIIICMTAIGAAVINPHGIFGFLYPFNIFTNYGYMIVENQSIFFLNTVMFNPMIRWLTIISPLVVVAFVLLLKNRKLIEALLLAIFFTATLFQIRHLPFFIWTAIPTISIGMATIIPKKLKRPSYRLLGSVFLSCIALTGIIFFASGSYAKTFDKSSTFGSAMIEDSKNASEFMIAQHIPGPIFNNFDIGGYAIYKLYPDYKVFVDNRPEAYPASFFTDVYIPLQQNPAIRKSVFDQYRINTIFFAHTDQTPWANEFMSSIAAEPEWKLIYLDTTTIILSKKTKLPDVRTDTEYLKKRVNESETYLDLLKLSRALSIFGNPELSRYAYEKAKASNPQSCAINRGLYERYKNTPLHSDAEVIRSNYWYCF